MTSAGYHLPAAWASKPEFGTAQDWLWDGLGPDFLWVWPGLHPTPLKQTNRDQCGSPKLSSFLKETWLVNTTVKESSRRQCQFAKFCFESTAQHSRG